MIKKIVNVIIFVFIFALYAVSFMFLFETFRQRKLETIEANALDTFDNSVKVEEKTIEEVQNDNTYDGGISYDDYTILGVIEIPAIGFKSVIIQENTYRAMSVGVIKSYGVGLNEPGGTVISGHNFRGRSLFMYNIKDLEPGDVIYITDASGRKVSYTVYEKLRHVDPGDTSIYNHFDGFHISLITCEDPGTSRIVVKAHAE